MQKTATVQREATQRAPWLGAIGFAVALLALGLGVAFLALATRPALEGVVEQPDLLFPPWVFWAVWLLIYPAQGVALWLIWRQRRAKNVSAPVILFAVAWLQNLTFWLTDSLVTTAFIDTVGLALAYATAWLFARYSRAAARWLLPWLIWMPITTVLKWYLVAQL
jgi:tryptophan-rich sensory protein